jgi:hypothetical protein
MVVLFCFRSVMTTPADAHATTPKLAQLGKLLDEYLGDADVDGLTVFAKARRFGKEESNLWRALWLADPPAAAAPTTQELCEKALSALVKFMHEAWPQCKAKQGGLKALPADGGAGVAANLAARHDRATVRGGGGASTPAPAAFGPWREDTVFQVLSYLLFRPGSAVSSIRETVDASTLGGYIRHDSDEGRDEEAWRVLAARATRLGQWLLEQVCAFAPLRRLLALLHERDGLVLDTVRAVACMGFLEGSMAAARAPHAAAEWDKAAEVWMGLADKTIPLSGLPDFDVASSLAMRVWGWCPCDEGVNGDGECPDLDSVEDTVRLLCNVVGTATDAQVRVAAEAGCAAKRCAQCSIGFLMPCRVPEHEVGTVWADAHSRLFGAIDDKKIDVKKWWLQSDLVDTIALKTQGTPFAGSALALQSFVRQCQAQ